MGLTSGFAPTIGGARSVLFWAALLRARHGSQPVACCYQLWTGAGAAVERTATERSSGDITVDEADDEELPKPRELLSAREACEELFVLLQRWFSVPEAVTIDLAGIDSAVAELSDPQVIMAMAMRKLQALHLLTTPGVVTTSDVVLTMIQDLERALLQAPTMHMKQAAAEVDWDAELAALGLEPPVEPGDDLPEPDETAIDDLSGSEALPPSGDQAVDDEVARFRAYHATLHEAAKAVLHVSDGRIRRLR